MQVSTNIPTSELSSADATDVRTRTKEILRIATTDSTQDNLIGGYVASATRYLQSATGVLFTSQTVTELHTDLMAGSELTAARGPITATAKFGRFPDGGLSADQAFIARQDGWRVVQSQSGEDSYLIEYTAGLATLTDDIKHGIAQCAAGLYSSQGQSYKNTLRHLNRVFVL